MLVAASVLGGLPTVSADAFHDVEVKMVSLTEIEVVSVIGADGEDARGARDAMDRGGNRDFTVQEGEADEFFAIRDDPENIELNRVSYSTSSSERSYDNLVGTSATSTEPFETNRTSTMTGGNADEESPHRLRVSTDEGENNTVIAPPGFIFEDVEGANRINECRLQVGGTTNLPITASLVKTDGACGAPATSDAAGPGLVALPVLGLVALACTLRRRG